MKRWLLVLCIAVLTACSSETDAEVKPKVDKFVLSGDFKQDAQKYYDVITAAAAQDKLSSKDRSFIDAFDQSYDGAKNKDLTPDDVSLATSLGRMSYSVITRLKGDEESSDIVDFAKEKTKAESLLAK